MIPADSTGYPTTAVIQHFNLSGVQQKDADEAGLKLRKMLQKGATKETIDRNMEILFKGRLPEAVITQLKDNHTRAAIEHGYIRN